MTAPISGIINLDKPSQCSSARAVSRVKRLLPRGTKIGHAGTLDPFATGVLLLLVGKATRQFDRFMDDQKQYQVTIKLGATTETLDPDSPEILDESCPSACAAQDIEQILRSFIGTNSQLPPAYSALKVGGQRAYALARQGKLVVLQPRMVTIHAIEMTGYAWPMVDLRITCGKGTYIRSIARDIGERLGTSAYVTSLRRTRIGSYRDEDAVTIEVLESDGVEKHLYSIVVDERTEK